MAAPLFLTETQAVEFGRFVSAYLDHLIQEAEDDGEKPEDHPDWGDTETLLYEALQKIIGSAPVMNGEKPTAIIVCSACGQKNRVKINTVSRCGKCKKEIGL